MDKQLDTQTGRVRDGGDYLGLIQKLGFLLLPTDWPRHGKVVYQMPKRGWGEGWSYYLTWTGREIAEWHTGNCVIVAGNCVIVVYVSLSWYWKKFITQPIIRHTDWSIPNNSIVFGKNKKEKKKSSNDTRSIYRLTFDVTFISKHYSLFHYANVDIHVP